MLKEIGERIRARRKELDLTLHEFAQLVGVSRSTPGMWERGQNPVQDVVLPKIAEVLGTSVHWLKTGEETEGGNQHDPSLYLTPDERLLLIAFGELPASLKKPTLDYIRSIGDSLGRAAERPRAPHDEQHADVQHPIARPRLVPLVTERDNPTVESARQSDTKPALRVVPTPSEGSELSELAGYASIRLLGDVAAGIPRDAPRQGEDVQVPLALIPPRAKLKELGVLRVSGDSMEPTYPRGSLVLIEISQFGKYRKGDVVVALLYDEETVLKNYAGQRSGVITLTSDNPAYPPQRYQPGECVIQARLVALLDLRHNHVPTR